MAPLGPWQRPGAAAPIAIAVSGGADSTALAWLTAGWAAERGIALLALVVDHGIRPASAPEAAATLRRLAGLAIPARLLTLQGLSSGSALAERARLARYACLTSACRDAGAVDLLLGHHAGDQAETVLMRSRAASGADGLAGMAALVETSDLRLLRPLLPIAPARLRATLAGIGLGWIEDPSNRDLRAQRTRLRMELQADAGELGAGLLAQASTSGRARMRRQADAALSLAEAATLRPEGFALLPPELLPAPVLASLIRTVGGASYRPAVGSIESLVRRPHALTLSGTRLLSAGRLGPGWLLLREAASMQAELPATDGVLWDRRFRLDCPAAAAHVLDGVTVGPLGSDKAAFRAVSDHPAVILETLPVLRRHGAMLAVPHLGWSVDPRLDGIRFQFRPAAPATEATLFSDP